MVLSFKKFMDSFDSQAIHLKQSLHNRRYVMSIATIYWVPSIVRCFLDIIYRLTYHLKLTLAGVIIPMIQIRKLSFREMELTSKVTQLVIITVIVNTYRVSKIFTFSGIQWWMVEPGRWRMASFAPCSPRSQWGILMAASFSKGQSLTFTSNFLQSIQELITCFAVEQTEIHQRAIHRNWPLCVSRTKACLEILWAHCTCIFWLILISIFVTQLRMEVWIHWECYPSINISLG